MLVLSSGESSLFVIGSLSVDTVFYKEVFGEILVYIRHEIKFGSWK